MTSFTNNESYKHKCAKEIFKQWCDSESWDCGGCGGGDRCVPTKNGMELRWRSNRSKKAWLEYPIVVNGDINSAEMNWDEIWPGNKIVEFVPTYVECKEYKLQPISVIDIVLPHKGRPLFFIEICQIQHLNLAK